MEQRIWIDGIPGLYVASGEGKGAVLLLHGFLSYKDGDGFLLKRTAEKLADAGIGSLRIDFCSCGENRKSRKLYGQKTVLDEAERALLWLQKANGGPVGILGHSMGGRTAMLLETPVACKVLLNGMTDTTVPLELVTEPDFWPEGHCIRHMSDGRDELLFRDFVWQDQEVAGPMQTDCPVLVCIGNSDHTLECDWQKANFEKLVGKKSLLCTEGDHTFFAKTGDFACLDAVLTDVVAWIYKYLSFSV